MISRLWQRIPPVVLDCAVALLFTVLAQVELQVKTDDGYPLGPLTLNIVLQFLFTALLAFRSTWPRLTLGLMCAWMVLPNLVVGHTVLFWGDFLPLMLVNYTVARVVPGWWGRWSWLVCTASMMTFAIRVPEIRSVNEIAFPLALFGASSVLGRLIRRISVQSASLAAALAELSAGAAEREDAAVAAERRRIAAEMHDVVSHSVSLLTLQAGAARMRLESSGVPVPEQLRAAEDTGRRALTELRRTLGVLRETDQHGVAAPLAPLPDLAAVPGLVAEMQKAGLSVDVSNDVSQEIPASIQLTAYRVVQESLTNVLRHAGPVRATVAMAIEDSALTVEVRNAPGRRTPLPAGGHGLTGMRERVSMFAGTLDAGRLPDGGFVVRAVLPLESDREEGQAR
ncbi:MAG: hypothetical protein JSS74_14040 [Actinobacteria bacterium]|nr:hypothetical protein [Actinomycetota bacterium]